MVLSSTVKSCNYGDDAEKLPSRDLVVNTVNFEHQDLEDFVNISEEIERNNRERRSQRKQLGSRSKTMVATMTREEIFESTNIDDDRFLEAMEHETTYDTEKYHAALVNSIGNLMKYFDEDVNVRGGTPAPIRELTKGKVASAVAALRHKCGLSVSPVSKRKTKKSEGTTHIEDLKKKYETSTENETSPSPKVGKAKIPKPKRKTKVKQMALLFNNKINSMIKSSSPEPKTPDSVTSGIESIPSTAFTSTLKPKSPKVKRRVPVLVTKLPSPKPSPSFRKKQLPRSDSINSLAYTPLTKRKQLQKQSSTTCLVAENVFSQLSVKDKALLYNKFIADMSKQNPKFTKHAEVLESNMEKQIQQGEVVVEKQDSVRYLRDCWEAKLALSKRSSKTLQHFKRASSKLSLNVIPKSKEYEDLLGAAVANKQLTDDSQEPLHVSTLTVVLKSSPKSKKFSEKNTNQRQKKNNSAFHEDVSIIEPSYKRTQSMIRSSYCVEPLAPPKKIRRTRHERLAPEIFFQNQHLEKLFYHWLKEKNGIAFDITPVNNSQNVIEIVPKNTRDNVLPPEEVNEMLEAAIKLIEAHKQGKLTETANKNDGIALIKNTLDSQNESIIEVELPVEVEMPKAERKETETEDSDLGLVSIPKTTSEDSTEEFQIHDSSTLSTKLLRKKKSRRPFNCRQLNTPTTDSDSDSKAKALKLQNCTLTNSKKCSNYIKSLILKTFSSSMSSEQICHLNNDLLDRSLIKQFNSPSKIKNAYTLTIMSTPSPHSESDFPDSDPAKSLQKETSRSWPSLEEAMIASDTNLLKYKYLSNELADVANCKMQQEPQKGMVDSFIDQGFETGCNDAESPVRLSRKSNQDASRNKFLTNKETPENFFTPINDKTRQQVFNPQTEPAEYNKSNSSSSTISSSSTPAESAYLTMTIMQEDGKTENSEEINSATSALNETCSFTSQHVPNKQSSSHFNVTHKTDSSQFWITSGEFTAAIAIDHYESDRLSLLSNIYGQKSSQNNEMNFGIDDQKFCCDNSATSDEIIAELPQQNNCSHYWFSTGDLIIPFRGKEMTTRKIQAFFTSVREFMEGNGYIKFGIDGYEFSNIHQDSQNSFSFYRSRTWSKPISPLKTSDLDQSDVDSQELEKSITFSALSPHLDNTCCSSSDFIHSQQSSSTNPQTSAFPDELSCSDRQTDKNSRECYKPEILKKQQNPQTKLMNINGLSESTDYTKKLRRSVGKFTACWGH